MWRVKPLMSHQVQNQTGPWFMIHNCTGSCKLVSVMTTGEKKSQRSSKGEFILKYAFYVVWYNSVRWRWWQVWVTKLLWFMHFRCIIFYKVTGEEVWLYFNRTGGFQLLKTRSPIIFLLRGWLCLITHICSTLYIYIVFYIFIEGLCIH